MRYSDVVCAPRLPRQVIDVRVRRKAVQFEAQHMSIPIQSGKTRASRQERQKLWSEKEHHFQSTKLPLHLPLHTLFHCAFLCILTLAVPSLFPHLFIPFTFNQAILLSLNHSCSVHQRHHHLCNNACPQGSHS
jgi:hypothetical protein